MCCVLSPWHDTAKAAAMLAARHRQSMNVVQRFRHIHAATLRSCNFQPLHLVLQDMPSKPTTRRHLLRQAALAGAAWTALRTNPARGEELVTLPFANGERQLVKFPQKRPLLLLTHRPPQLETPFSVFREGVLTPNDAFFVRYHLANIPRTVDVASFRLEVKGMVNSFPSMRTMTDSPSRRRKVAWMVRPVVSVQLEGVGET